MNSLESFIDTEHQKNVILQETTEESSDRYADKELLNLIDRLDLIDIIVLKKFYATGRKFPLDTQPYCFPILFKEMKENNNLKIGTEALRKRLDILTKRKFLEKVNNSNPTNYFPINGKEGFVRLLITKFFVLNGLTKFL
jgi:hypothetical protein